MKILFNPQPKRPNHHPIWNSVYFYISMDFTYLPQRFCSNFFFEKKVWLEDILLTYSLDICQNILLNPLLKYTKENF